MSIQFEYDEALGNAPTRDSPFSVARHEDFFKATERVVPYRLPASGDATQAIAPLVFVEKIFRCAQVEDPSKLSGIPFLSRCLHLNNFLYDGLEFLLSEGLVEKEDDGTVIPFDTVTELQEKADTLVEMHKDNPLLIVDETRWDAFEDASAGSEFQWLQDLSLQELTMQGRNLKAYIDLCMLVGPRAIDAERDQAGGQLKNVAGGATGGDLIAKMNEYYGTTASPHYLKGRLEEFLTETTWDFPFNIEFKQWESYGFDLGARATWSKTYRRRRSG